MIAWLKRIAARLECAFTGRHVQPRTGTRRSFRRDCWQCERCCEWVMVYRGPK